MKVLKRLTGLAVISSLMLVIGACGKQTQTPYSILGSNYTYGSCDASATGENVYDGTIVPSQVSSSYTQPSGNVKLTVIPTGGQVYGQYTASAVLTLNGSQYCCTSQGMGGVLGQPMTDDEKYTVTGLTLICNSTGTSGYYTSQAITLTIGVPVQVPTWESGEAILTTDQRLMGYIKVAGGSQNIGYYGTNSYTYGVE